MTEQSTPENLEKPSQQAEVEKPVEKSAELKEDHTLAGAELLENPPDGSFVQGLQAFVAWVKSVVAPKD